MDERTLFEEHFAKFFPEKWTEKELSSYDACLVCTAHKGVDYQQLANWSQLIIDTRNALNGCHFSIGRVKKA